jgi:fatty acid desaturase
MTTNIKYIWGEDLGITKKVEQHSKKTFKKELKKYSIEEVNKHNKKNDCWIVIHNYIYDITSFIDKHPGGENTILNIAGKDVTDIFLNYHPIRVYKYLLPKYIIGELKNYEIFPFVKDIRNVRATLLKKNLFKTDYNYYFKFSAYSTILLVLSLKISLGAIDYYSEYYRLIGAIFMGIFWQQMAGIGHDIGHSSISHDYNTDYFIGCILSLFMGFSMCWWKDNHNIHHIHSNSVENDPNIQHMPILAVDEKIFKKPYWHTYRKKIILMNKLSKFLISYQHYIFYPLVLLGRFNIYIQQFKYLIYKSNNNIYRNIELCLISCFLLWVSYIVYIMPSYIMGIQWLLISHIIAGILHIQIILSHWSRDILTGDLFNSKTNEWNIMQLNTTMNIKTPKKYDFIHIGLQFQIEHHLFPRLPRHNLRYARTLVKEVCEKHKIHYHELSFLDANIELWNSMKDTAYKARNYDLKKNEKYEYNKELYNTKIWEGLNLIG